MADGSDVDRRSAEDPAGHQHFVPVEDLAKIASITEGFPLVVRLAANGKFTPREVTGLLRLHERRQAFDASFYEAFIQRFRRRYIARHGVEAFSEAMLEAAREPEIRGDAEPEHGKEDELVLPNALSDEDLERLEHVAGPVLCDMIHSLERVFSPEQWGRFVAPLLMDSAPVLPSQDRFRLIVAINRALGLKVRTGRNALSMGIQFMQLKQSAAGLEPALTFITRFPDMPMVFGEPSTDDEFSRDLKSVLAMFDDMDAARTEARRRIVRTSSDPPLPEMPGDTDAADAFRDAKQFMDEAPAASGRISSEVITPLGAAEGDDKVMSADRRDKPPAGDGKADDQAPAGKRESGRILSPAQQRAKTGRKLPFRPAGVSSEDAADLLAAGGGPAASLIPPPPRPPADPDSLDLDQSMELGPTPDDQVEVVDNAGSGDDESDQASEDGSESKDESPDPDAAPLDPEEERKLIFQLLEDHLGSDQVSRASVRDMISKAKRPDSPAAEPARRSCWRRWLGVLLFWLVLALLALYLGVDQFVGPAKPRFQAVVRDRSVAAVVSLFRPQAADEAPVASPRVIVQTVTVPGPERPASDYRGSFIRDLPDFKLGVGGPIEVRRQPGESRPVLYLRSERTDGGRDVDLVIDTGEPPP